MSDMMTNVCCAARASRCQHATPWHSIEKNISRNDTWCNTIMKKREWLWLGPQLQPVCESNAWQRQSWKGGQGEDEWMHADGRAGTGVLEMKPHRPGKRPYFQIRWDFRLSWGWRPPPWAGPRGTLGWTSMSGLQMPPVGRHPHILSKPSQPGQAPRKKTGIFVRVETNQLGTIYSIYRTNFCASAALEKKAQNFLTNTQLAGSRSFLIHRDVCQIKALF